MVFACHFCGSISQDIVGFKAHQCDAARENSYQHQIGLPVFKHENSKSTGKLNECKMCNFKTRTRSQMFYHRIIHPENNCCSICGRKYKTYSKFSEHLIKHKPASFGCEICGRLFKLKACLNRHIRSHGTKSIPCEVCGNLFKSPHDVRRHIRSVHGKKHWVSCDECTLKCDSIYLERHKVETHRRLKPYACEICEFKCARFGNLQLHRTGFHKAIKMKVQQYRELVQSGNHRYTATCPSAIK